MYADHVGRASINGKCAMGLNSFLIIFYAWRIYTLDKGFYFTPFELLLNNPVFKQQQYSLKQHTQVTHRHRAVIKTITMEALIGEPFSLEKLYELLTCWFMMTEVEGLE
jgi:hypothetical protein